MQKLNTTMSNNSVTEQIITEKVNECKTELKIPIKNLYAYDLKKLKSYRTIRQDVKHTNQLIIFENDVGSLLKCFKIDEFNMNTELLELVLQLTEDYFIFGNQKQRDTMKKQAINNLMLQYFKNDQEILDNVMRYAYTNVRKSNFFKRSYSKLVVFFKKKE
jgi:hypothetical protein